MSRKIHKNTIVNLLRDDTLEVSPAVDERILGAARDYYAQKGIPMTQAAAERDGESGTTVARDTARHVRRYRILKTVGAAALLVGVVAVLAVVIKQRNSAYQPVPAGKDTVSTKPTPEEVTPTAEPEIPVTDLVLLWAEDRDGENAQEGVEKFRKAATEQGLLNNSYLQKAAYYNAAPKQLEELTGVAFFKRSDENGVNDYLMYRGTAYEACRCFGDVGVCQIAVADLNSDGKPEVYYTSLSGSGITSVTIHCFDTATAKISELLFRVDYATGHGEGFVPERRTPGIVFTRGFVGGIGMVDEGPLSSWWGWITYDGDEPVCEVGRETWQERKQREQEEAKQQENSETKNEEKNGK